MAQWPELGERIRERIEALGYENAGRFADAKGYRITYVYKWVKGTLPSRENLYRLARDLGVSPAWLMFGTDSEQAKSPRPPLKRRGAAIVVLALSLLGWASAEAQPLPLDGPLQHNPDSIGNSLQNQHVRMSLIGRARRFLWWFGCDWGTIAPAY